MVPWLRDHTGKVYRDSLTENDRILLSFKLGIPVEVYLLQGP